MRRQRSTQAYPLDRFDTNFIRDLARHPRLIAIWHPVYCLWQVYENQRESGWTAERLYNAIVGEHAHYGTSDHERYLWWNIPGSPYVLDDALVVRPGSWTLRWADEREDRRQNLSPSQWWAMAEEKRLRMDLAKKAAVHDMNLAISKDAYRHARDAARGDSLAGKRKYVISKDRGLGGAR